MHSLAKTFFMIAIFVQATPPVATVKHFKFQRGVKYTTGYIYSNSLPTMYQCAAMCLRIRQCASMIYNREQKMCHISENRIALVHKHADFNMAFREDIPWDLAGNCQNHGCVVDEICMPGHLQNQCLPFKQCLDAMEPISSSYCTTWTSYGGCLESTIGKTVGTYFPSIWTYGNWKFQTKYCKRSCMLCDTM